MYRYLAVVEEFDNGPVESRKGRGRRAERKTRGEKAYAMA